MEISKDGEIWGTICDKGWNLNDARVICKQLSFSNGVAAVPMAGFGAGSGAIFLKMLIVKGMSDHCLSVNTVAGRIMSLISRVTTAWTSVSSALHPRELVKFIDILHRLTHGGVTLE